MKKGINFWSFGPGTTAKQAINIAKSAGFEGLELSMGEEGIDGKEGYSPNELKKMAGDAGLELPSFASGLGWTYPLTGRDELRQKGMDFVKRQLDIAAELGAHSILVLPGLVGVDFIPDAEVVDYEVAYERAFEAISALKVHAKGVKVNLALENVWNKFLLSPLEMRRFVDDIDSEYVGVYLDIGNTILTGYPDQWVRIMGNRIKMVHFKDYRRDPGGFNSFVDLLAGDVDYPAVYDALKNIGYSGYCVAEMIPGYKHYSDQIIYNASKSMDRILHK